MHARSGSDFICFFEKVQDLRMQFATKTDTDDQIMVAVNAKVEEWKVCGNRTYN